MMDTRRCVICGCPNQDHTPLRYVLRASVRHYLLGKARILSKGWR